MLLVILIQVEVEVTIQVEEEVEVVVVLVLVAVKVVAVIAVALVAAVAAIAAVAAVAAVAVVAAVVIGVGVEVEAVYSPVCSRCCRKKALLQIIVGTCWNLGVSVLVRPLSVMMVSWRQAKFNAALYYFQMLIILSDTHIYIYIYTYR